MKCFLSTILILLFCFAVQAQPTGNIRVQQIAAVQIQPTEISQARKNVRTSGDVLTVALPAACLVTTLALQDWEGLKQGAFTGLVTVGVGYGLKLLIDKERPDKSNDQSFPSLHTGVSFASAAFLQRRYGWKWGIPAYAIASYVGWSRVYGKKHDWWDVTAGLAMGIGSAYLFTKPFAQKHQLTIAPVAGDRHIGVYASLCF